MEEQALTRRQVLMASRPAVLERDRPPGVNALGLGACTGCAKCAECCPTGIIALVDGVPALDFTIGACTFCAACAAACPEPVFIAGPTHHFSHIIAISRACLPFNGVDCQACRDTCPGGAIRFQPVRGGPFVPELAEDACSGCGACISVCPVGAIATARSSKELLDA